MELPAALGHDGPLPWELSSDLAGSQLQLSAGSSTATPAEGPIPDLPPEGPDHGPLWQVGGEPAEMLAELGARGLTRIFCEGGGQLAASLLRAGLVDELVGYTAGLVLGGDARPAVGTMGLAALADAPRFDLIATRSIGRDVLHHWRRAR